MFHRSGLAVGAAALVAFALLAVSTSMAQTAWYVDDDAALGGNGASWGTAYRYLQDALLEAQSNSSITEIRVAGGLYRPDQDEAGRVVLNRKTETFNMADDLTISGGYRGLASGGAVDDRDFIAFETILSGNIGSHTSYTDNSYHVVTSLGNDDTAVLDGVTVRDGYARHLSNNYQGHGGGVYLVSSSMVISNCIITANRTWRSSGDYSAIFDIPLPKHTGAGLYCDGGTPLLLNCSIVGNLMGQGRPGWQEAGTCQGIEPGGDGAGAYFSNSEPMLIHCRISENVAGKGGQACSEGYMAYPGESGGDGGGLYFDSCANVACVGCEITNNSAGEGGIAGSSFGDTARGGHGGHGGGVYLNVCENMYFLNCRLKGNLGGAGNDSLGSLGSDGGGSGGNGAALYTTASSNIRLIGCELTNNLSGAGGTSDSMEGEGPGGNGGAGPAIYSSNSTITLTNCTIAANQSGLGGDGTPPGADGAGAICTASGSAPVIANAILWDNHATGTVEQQQIAGAAVVNCSCVQGWTGGLGGTGNLGSDPAFADVTNGDYRLLATSPCIDAADSTAVPLDEFDLDGNGDTTERLPLDLDGRPRFIDVPSVADTGVADPPNYPAVVDMGAYEFGIAGDLDGDCSVTLSDLAQLLGDYGVTSGACYADGDLDGDGDVDLADLAALLGVYGTSCPQRMDYVL